MIDPGLRGHVALVSGANQGIGAAVARALAGGGRAAAWEADLADPATPAALFDRAEAALGPVEILVNNAGAWTGDTFLPASVDRLGRRLAPVSAATHDHTFAVNSRATALLIAEFARRHLARGAAWGRIVSLTTGGAPGFPQEVSYGASKNALESYTVAAAAELAPLGVTANILCPPATDTGWVTPELAADLLRDGRRDHVATPEEVAEVVVFLASQQARYLTGQRLAMF